MARANASRDLLAAIERGDIEPLYCLHGAERYRIDVCVRAIRQAIVGDHRGSALNYDVFDLKESALAQAVACARTLPMLAKRRLVIARGIDLVKAEAFEPLLQYLADPNPTACLVMLTDKADKVDGRLKAFTALKKAGYLHEFARLSDRELPEWLMVEARRRTISLEPEAAQALAAAAGPDLGRLAQALDQLALFAANPGSDKPPHVRADDVDNLIPESRQRQIYELTKAISRQDEREAVRLVAALFDSGELPPRQMALRLQGSLLHQLRRIWRARELLSAGTPARDLASALGVPPFAVDELLAPARRASVAMLAGDFQRLYRADRALKSSRTDPKVYVTRLVRSMCGARA